MTAPESVLRGWARAMLATSALLVGVLIAACGGADSRAASGAASSGGGLGTDAETLELGRAVYSASCATCHGPRGEGQPNWQSRQADGTLPPPPHDASGHTWHHPDEVLIEIITVGGQRAYGGPGITSTMPAFGDRLTSEEIRAVLSYIKSLWGDDERTYQESLR